MSVHLSGLFHEDGSPASETAVLREAARIRRVRKARTTKVHWRSTDYPSLPVCGSYNWKDGASAHHEDIVFTTSPSSVTCRRCRASMRKLGIEIPMEGYL